LAAEIALLRSIVHQMAVTMEAQGAYVERLDDLWHQHMLDVVADAAEEPTYEDVWEVDQSKTDLNLTFRVEAL